MKTRFATKRRWFRKPLVVLQIEEERHHTRDLYGSGYYDDWTTKHWRNATPEDLMNGALVPDRMPDELVDIKYVK